MSRYIVKTMNLRIPKHLIIWDGWSRSYRFIVINFGKKKEILLCTHCLSAHCKNTTLVWFDC
jgi:hypothetical protein